MATAALTAVSPREVRYGRQHQQARRGIAVVRFALEAGELVGGEYRRVVAPRGIAPRRMRSRHDVHRLNLMASVAHLHDDLAEFSRLGEVVVGVFDLLEAKDAADRDA